ncbi:unnamed protein product [Dicrocoelium dendriticum]|nr:unnamed protein product [Dicrocoelium dendriticum]
MAPEMVRREPYGKAVDAWSCGLLLFTLLSGSLPFYGTRDVLFTQIVSGRYHFQPKVWNMISTEARDLVMRLLEPDPVRRMSIEEALHHPWISQKARASKTHLHETVEEMRRFNARRRLKSAILAAVSSTKWASFYTEGETGDNLDSLEEDDEVTSAAVSAVLDSLEEMQCLTGCSEKDADLFQSVFEDEHLHCFLEYVFLISSFLQPMACRALHYVFKVGDRGKCVGFLKDVLGMKILRHEEFTEGCEASCNGPYDGKWSKTMVGYGPEDTHFVLELTYNYGVGSYKLGNDFQYIRIDLPEAFDRVARGHWPTLSASNECVEVEMPGGYRFQIHNQNPQADPVRLVALSSSDLQRSVDYWSGLCGMRLVSRTSTDATLCFEQEQCHLKLISIPSQVEHASAFGRIAFACPRDQLLPIQQLMDDKKQTVLKRLVSLDTPGKATVEVVILADPDGHEICFVGDEAFRQLSQVDPHADRLLSEAMSQDQSDAWFQERGGKGLQ